MFIRTKKIKGQDYAYLVENKWTKKGTRQKVKAYLGRVVDVKLQRDVDFSLGSEGSAKNITKALVKWELLRHGFEENKCLIPRRTVIAKDNIIINLRKLSIQSKGRDVVLRLNEGFMCSHSLKHLLRFKSYGEEDEVGLELATAYAEAGIMIPKELFIEIYQKVFNKKQSRMK